MSATAPRVDARHHELGELLRLLRAVDRRPDRVVLVTGEAGIGKTYLARAAIARLGGEGFRVAWGRADPVERAVPYAAIGQVLASVSGPDVEGGQVVLVWEPDHVTGRDAVVREVYRPVGSLFERQCAEGPLVVVVDDLHHADQDTLLLLGFLVRRLVHLPIAWLFTLRSRLAEPAAGLERLLHGLGEDGRLDEVALAALPDDDIARLVSEVAGRDLDAGALRAIVERASGNPFFAVQLALSVGDAGAAHPGTRSAVGIVPSASRRVALLERLFPLGADARMVARVAAVLGDVELEQLEGLATALGLDIADVRHGFDRLVRANLLRPGTTSPTTRRYEFVHDLVREAVYADLGPAERRRIHGATGEALLDRRSRGEAVDLVELARHLSLGSRGGSREADARAAAALRDAGDVLVATSPRSAVVRYQRALDYLPAGGAGEADLHVRLARALRRVGEPDEVVAVCRHGLGRADGPARDRLTRYLAAALADRGSFRDALGIVDREVDARGPSATLLTTRALLLRLLDDVDGSAAATDHAASVARTLPERLAVLFQRLNLAVEVGAAARPDLAIADIERLLPSLDPESRLMAHAHLAGACGGLGEMLRCRHHLDAAAALEAEGVLDVDWPWSFAARVVLDVQQARWDEAIRTYEQGAPEFGSGLRLLSRNHAATSALDVPLHRRDVENARRLAADVVDIGGSGAYSRGLAQSVVDRLSGRPDTAIERLDALVAGASRLPMRGVALLAHLAYAHEESGGLDQARRALDERRDLAAGQDSAYAHALVNLLEARFRDDIDAARAGAETAAANGLVQYEAACRLELGRLGVDAAPNLLAAHAVFRSVGAMGYIAAAEAEMRRHGVRAPTRRRRDPWALSEAEQRVVTLVAEGLTNRAIAERLSYSVKTIEAYLSRVYAKTGCANRVELVNHLAARERFTTGRSQPESPVAHPTDL